MVVQDGGDKTPVRKGPVIRIRSPVKPRSPPKRTQKKMTPKKQSPERPPSPPKSPQTSPLRLRICRDRRSGQLTCSVHEEAECPAGQEGPQEAAGVARSLLAPRTTRR